MNAGIGLALSGGGVRGIAHIGVLRALAEHGIEANIVSGSSSGAIVGALYAAGYTAEKMVEFFKTKHPFHLSKLSLGKPGLIDTRKVEAEFLEYFPEDSFAALGKPLIVTATDILNGRLVTFESGPLILPLIASCSVPMLFTPTRIDGRWYVDGGILSNFPVEVLEGRCASIIGVFASPLEEIEQSDLKTSFAVTRRALEVGMYSHSRAKFGHCDLLLCPPDLTRFGLFDTRHVDEIAELGYDAAVRELPAIERLVQAAMTR